MRLKTLLKCLLWICLPAMLLYWLALRCQRRKWPEGLKGARFAHRGLHHQPEAPENSLAAFRAALEKGYGVELDVHLMKDGHLAVIHDSSLQRTAGVSVDIEDLTREELEGFFLEGTTERIPLLDEVLALFSGENRPILVELKAARGNHDELTAAACALLDQYDVPYCIESFDPRVLMWLKNNRPEIIRGQLSTDMRNNKDHSPLTMWVLTHLLCNFLTVPDFIAYDKDHRAKCLELKICRQLYGAREFSWTVTSPEEAGRLEEEGCGIIFEGFTL